MVFPWTSQRKLESKYERLAEQLDELRAIISKQKTEIKDMEKSLYWGDVSLSRIKAERKDFLSTQKRIRRVKKKMRALKERLGGVPAAGSTRRDAIDADRQDDE